MHNLRCIAIPVAVLGLRFLFFCLIWTGAVQLAVAVPFLAIAATIWRTSSDTWPLTNTSPGRPGLAADLGRDAESQGTLSSDCFASRIDH
jgi:hypothetical protein